MDKSSTPPFQRPNSSASEDLPGGRGKRWQIAPRHLTLLEQVFALDSSPSKSVRARLASEFCVSPHQVRALTAGAERSAQRAFRSRTCTRQTHSPRPPSSARVRSEPAPGVCVLYCLQRAQRATRSDALHTHDRPTLFISQRRPPRTPQPAVAPLPPKVLVWFQNRRQRSRRAVGGGSRDAVEEEDAEMAEAVPYETGEVSTTTSGQARPPEFVTLELANHEMMMMTPQLATPQVTTPQMANPRMMMMSSQLMTPQKTTHGVATPASAPPGVATPQSPQMASRQMAAQWMPASIRPRAEARDEIGEAAGRKWRQTSTILLYNYATVYYYATSSSTRCHKFLLWRLASTILLYNYATVHYYATSSSTWCHQLVESGA
jgi:hypothetical protein